MQSNQTLKHNKISIEFTPPTALPQVTVHSRNLAKSPSQKLVSKSSSVLPGFGNLPSKFQNSPYVLPEQTPASPRPSNVIGRHRLLRNYSPLLSQHEASSTFRVPQPQVTQ